MRMSREAMAGHRRDIIAAAARMLRERGIEGTSVADLMQAAGLTHGGFYRHFDSKAELVAEAAASAYGDILEGIESKSGKSGAVEAVDEYITQYLSRRHVTKPGFGCPMAALGVEAAREGKAVQQVFAKGTEDLLGKLSAGRNGSAAERRSHALRILATLVGAIVIARAVGDDRLSEEVLSACRETALPARVDRRSR